MYYLLSIFAAKCFFLNVVLNMGSALKFASFKLYVNRCIKFEKKILEINNS